VSSAQLSTAVSGQYRRLDGYFIGFFPVFYGLSGMTLLIFMKKNSRSKRASRVHECDVTSASRLISKSAARVKVVCVGFKMLGDLRAHLIERLIEPA
jgi:hypothetical protein